MDNLFFVCLNDKLMFSVLGKVLTPILLLFLVILICIGIYNSSSITAIPTISYKNFASGFFQGYETMDLFI